jgi:tetrapyrrole methylase family protein/MazG family protein
VLLNWEKLKAAERKANDQVEIKGILDGVPLIFPSLAQAQEFQERAARVGFDWSEVQPVIAKVIEELEEVQTASSLEEQTAELGDLLFAAVNLARWYKVDAESALRETNQRFRKRFSHIEKRAGESGRNLSDMTLAEMDVFWDEAKRLE